MALDSELVEAMGEATPKGANPATATPTKTETGMEADGYDGGAGSG
jgi:hypothetical protein